MTTVQVPPDGVPAVFTVDVPAPDGMTTIAGVRVKTSWSGAQHFFVPKVTIAGVQRTMSEAGTLPNGRIWTCIFPSQAAPTSVTVTVEFSGSTPEPGNSVSLTIQGAQTETGAPPLNPDAGGDPTFFGEEVPVGTVEILSWQEWRRLNQG